VDFRNWRQLSFWITELLGNKPARLEISKRAYEYGRRMTWPRVIAAYEKLFAAAAGRDRVTPGFEPEPGARPRPNVIPRAPGGPL
jgi:hypothetical protein